MGRRKRNETEADDEEGKRLMLKRGIDLFSFCQPARYSSTHNTAFAPCSMIASILRSCRVPCRLQNNIRRLLPFVDVR